MTKRNFTSLTSPQNLSTSNAPAKCRTAGAPINHSSSMATNTPNAGAAPEEVEVDQQNGPQKVNGESTHATEENEAEKHASTATEAVAKYILALEKKVKDLAERAATKKP
jgi:Ran GTPase-activating protein (RanGAP) involved in mRNA processing and transport